MPNTPRRSNRDAAPAKRSTRKAATRTSASSRSRKAKVSPRRRAGAAGPGDAILHLDRWIRENRKHLKPPVSNRQLFTDSDDAIVFVSGGPNTRNDYHVNPTEELFFQVKGDIAVRIRPLDGSPPRDVVVREGELYLLPRWVPHRPQRPAGTIGLIIEFPRPKGEKDGLRWYCPECDELVHEAKWRLKKIDEDLKVIMERFWSGPAKRRTCGNCGNVIERAGAFKMSAGKSGRRTASRANSSR
ncbi:MAG: 3-hydroxyanthranilate 3,4-dioxygenase [Phycisphaerales bacterium]